jgi:hypothetical protein
VSGATMTSACRADDVLAKDRLAAETFWGLMRLRRVES